MYSSGLIENFLLPRLLSSVLGCRFLAGEVCDLSKDADERTEMKMSLPGSLRSKVPGGRGDDPCAASL